MGNDILHNYVEQSNYTYIKGEIIDYIWEFR